MTISLSEAIARFDRKERRAVLRMFGGDEAALVDQRCAAALAAAFGLPAEAIEGQPWYIDYHWNWIVGAITTLQKGATSIGRAEAPEHLIKNSQEDTDALVVVGNTLLLIEAKWDGSWAEGQLRSKALRLAALLQYIKSFKPEPAITIHVVFVSRRRDEIGAQYYADMFRDICSIRPALLWFDDIFGTLPRDLWRINKLGKGVKCWQIGNAPGWT